MQPDILGPGVTAAGAEEAGQRPVGAALERLAIDVPLAFESGFAAAPAWRRYCPIPSAGVKPQRMGLRSGSGMPAGVRAAGQRLELSRGEHRHRRTGVLGCDRRQRRRIWRRSAGLSRRSAARSRRRSAPCRIPSAAAPWSAAACRPRAWRRGRAAWPISIADFFSMAYQLVELLAAAIVAGHRLLILAAFRARRAGEAHMEMVVVVPPRPDLAEPGAVLADLRSHLA